jgi:hypothetical protein
MLTDKDTARVQAVTLAFGLLEAAYGKKWAGGSPAIWAQLLEDAEPEEVIPAVKAWCKANEWPPSPKDVLEAIPRFCRCGKCWPCHSRAVERAKRALERGSMGADFDTPERLTRGDVLPQRPALPPHE